ncbi:MAG: hypothetical protein HY913_04240 [Desulfomonile tiedjei]|nr:hypothetical protein [Desulfomonile tiedjei]
MDIENLEQQFATLSAAISSFLQGNEPSTKSQFFGYVAISTKLELKLISLKTELSLALADTRAEFDRQLRELNSHLPDKSTRDARDRLRWEPVPLDLRQTMETLETYISALEDYKWLLQGQKKTFERFVQHIGGQEF